MIWTGLSFVVLGHHDGRFLHLSGLYGFARRDPQHGSLLLFAGQAEDLSQATAPAHPQWEEALRLGMDELHVHFPVPRRIDRLQLLARVVRHGDKVQLRTHADDQYETARSGFRKARSITSVTGERADRVLVDDPHNLSEAESEAERDKTVQNFRENVLNRVNDADRSAIVVIMQRVHEKDVAGEILREELDFEHLCLPMRFEMERRCCTSIFTDPRGFEGELLFPQLVSVEAVERYRRRMGTYAFAAQYQQAPVSREGNWFKRAFFPLTDGPPPALRRRVMAWDLASTEKMGSNDPDWTVGLLGGLDEAGDIWILDMFRFRKSPAEREALIAEVVRRYGHDVLQLFPLDPAQAGKTQEHNFKTLLSQHSQLKFASTRGDKKKRVMDSGALVDAELRRIRLSTFALRDDFLDEVCAFPGGGHDDIVDALADLVRELRQGSDYELTDAAVRGLEQLNWAICGLI